MRRAIQVAIPTALATLALLWFLVEQGRTNETERVLGQLPSTAKAVVRVNVASIAEEPAWRSRLDALLGEDQWSDIEAECGIDPTTALDELVLWAGGPDDEPFQTLGLLIRGSSIDAEGFAQCYRQLVEARGSEVTRLPTARVPVLGSTDGRSALAEVDDHTVVTGSASTVAEFLAVAGESAPSLEKSPEFESMWSRAHGGVITGAFIAPPRWQTAIARIGAINEDASALEGVEAIGLRTDPRAPGVLTLLFDVRDEGTARRDAALIEVWAQSNPDTVPASWRDALRAADVSATGTELRVALDLASRFERPD